MLRFIGRLFGSLFRGILHGIGALLLRGANRLGRFIGRLILVIGGIGLLLVFMQNNPNAFTGILLLGAIGYGIFRMFRSVLPKKGKH